MSGERPIVYDAACGLWAGPAAFVRLRDAKRRFRLVAMQSAEGETLYRRFGWPWRAAGAARLLPAGLRDRLYRWVARQRYRLFGRRDSCPPPEEPG